MSLLTLTRNYADYNLWTNQTLVAWLRTKPEELLKKSIPSSYPSIIETIAHIRNTEIFWLDFMQGGAPVFQEGFNDDVADTLKGLVHQSQRLSYYVQSLGDDDLLAICELNQPWMNGNLPRYEFIQHCINHTSYHRGQVITIARNLGITDPPMTDYNYFNMVIKPKLQIQ